CPAKNKDALPAVRNQEPCAHHCTNGYTDRKSTKYRRRKRRAIASWGIFRDQRNGARQGTSQSQTNEDSQCNQFAHGGRKGRRKGSNPENKQRCQEGRLSAESVCECACGQR